MDAVNTYLDEVVRRLAAAAGDELEAVYLHGSAAMGAYVASRSDVDVLAVTRGVLPTAAKARAADRLVGSALRCPAAGGLELSIVSRASARTPSDRPSFELHVSTLDGTADGDRTDGDPDLVAHFAMTRAHGIALLGPPAIELIAPVERARLLRSLAGDLTWAVDHALASYAVLNACRALRFARDGILCSKPDGARWALIRRVADADLLIAALDRQSGADREVDLGAAADLAARVRAELLAGPDGASV